jgi:hypothetical protein
MGLKDKQITASGVCKRVAWIEAFWVTTRRHNPEDHDLYSGLLHGVTTQKTMICILCYYTASQPRRPRSVFWVTTRRHNPEDHDLYSGLLHGVTTQTTMICILGYYMASQPRRPWSVFWVTTRHHNPEDHDLHSGLLHGVTTQKTMIFIFTTANTSNHTIWIFFRNLSEPSIRWCYCHSYFRSHHNYMLVLLVVGNQ